MFYFNFPFETMRYELRRDPNTRQGQRDVRSKKVYCRRFTGFGADDRRESVMEERG